MKFILKYIFVLLCLGFTQDVLAQAPNITYTPSTIKVTENAPFTISPQNTGGAVPAVVYGQVTTFAGSPTGLPGFVDGVGTAALFNNSQDLAKDAAGNLYVADASNNAIRKITPAGVVSTFAGSPTGELGFTDGQGTAARFYYPDGLAFDASGNLFVADYYNYAIRKITPDGTVTTFYQNQDPKILFDPQALFFDGAGNLIFALQYGHQVVKLSPTAVLTVIAGANEVPGSVDGVGLAARFNAPTDARLDAAGNLIIADSQNSELRKIAPDGTVTTIAGSANSPVLYRNGPALAARFNYLTGIEITSGGVIYIVDLLNNDIRKMMPDGTVSLVAGSPTQAPGNADGIFTAAQFSQPCYIRIDKTGTGYIAEWGLGGASRIRKIALAGYLLNGTLPQGLTFDSTTGTISGKVTAPLAKPLIDTVTAFNTSGFSATIITFQQASSIATLVNLVPSVGSLNPAFVSTTKSYVDSVSNATKTITLTPTATDVSSTITVNGMPVASGTPSDQIPLAVGSNIITTVINAQDGITKDTYIVNVIRAPDSDANLINLTVSEGTLSPVFNSGIITYADTVSNATTSITATPTASDITSTITVNGMPTASGTASNSIPLAVGSNTITVVVTAQDGVTTHTYTVIVYRGDAEADLNSNNVLTPNGDGKNDYWVIKDIELYPQNNVTVFDKGGRVVYFKRAYNNEWGGTLNGKPLAEGAYYYVVDLGPNHRKFRGFISIIRN